MSNQIYCGNNLYEVGNRRIGTPYECLKKGVGQGLHSNMTGFNPNYQPIIANNTYCGTNNPPAGKEMGTPTACLRKGVGIGKKMQYDRGGAPAPAPGPLTPLLPVVHRLPVFSWKEFLMKWWPVILALLLGVITALFKASYTTILLTIIGTLVISWFIQTMMNK